jgi:hypothetical protein
MKLRKHKDKSFILKVLFTGERSYQYTSLLGNDAESVLKGWLFGLDRSKVLVVSCLPQVYPQTC